MEKTDRLYRNIKDWVELDGMTLEIHLVKENVVLSDDSRSHEKFIHGIKVLMATSFIDNLSKEARKRLSEKAQQGIWPARAPLGCPNVVRADGNQSLRTGHEAIPRAKKEEVNRINAQIARLQQRIETAYDNRLVGCIDADLFAQRSRGWRDHQSVDAVGVVASPAPSERDVPTSGPSRASASPCGPGCRPSS